MILFLHYSHDKNRIICSSLRHKAKLNFTNRHYSIKPFFKHTFHHLHTMLKKLHSSIAAAVSDVTLPLEDWNHYT